MDVSVARRASDLYRLMQASTHAGVRVPMQWGGLGLSTLARTHTRGAHTHARKRFVWQRVAGIEVIIYTAILGQGTPVPLFSCLS